MNLQELKTRSPAELLAFAEELEIENCNSMRKQDMMFAILKQLASQNVPISGVGVLEVLQDGFGFLRSPEENYLASLTGGLNLYHETPTAGQFTNPLVNEITVAVQNNGANQPINNLMPYEVVNAIIATQGTYPSRS